MLARKNVNDRQVKVFLDELIPETGTTRTSNARQRVLELFRNGKGNHGRTCWDLVNGYAEHLDWDGGGEQDRLIDSRLFGYRAEQKARAFDLALAL